jgi:hypothetical protein
MRLDPRRIENRISNKIDQKISQTITGLWMGAVISLLLLGGFAWGAWFIWSTVKESMEDRKRPAASKTKHDAALSDWDGEAPFTCGGVDEVKLKGVKAKLDGQTAVTVNANCRLELVDVEIDADVAVLARGNGVVTVKGGRLAGAKSAVVAEANATVTGKGVEVSGATHATGHARIDVK